MDIVQAIKHPDLFRPFLTGKDDSLKTWRTWIAILKVLYGLPIKNEDERKFVRQVSGRKTYTTPKEGGFDTGLFLTGRRSGKSRISSLVAAFEACMVPTDNRLDQGERGVVAIVSPTMNQSRIVKDYTRAIFQLPVFEGQVAKASPTTIELKNGNRIEIFAGSYRSIRGYTLLAAIIDEICFFGVDEEFVSQTDISLIRAVKPALATTGGKLIAIGSPYARRGWAYGQWDRYRNADNPYALIVKAPSRDMNETLPQSLIDEALKTDYASAKAEYLAEWRDDVALWLPRDVIEKVVVADRRELLPRDEHRYQAFVDVSGGRSDGSALAIGHQQDGKVVVDACYHWKAPHDPYRIVACMAEELRRFGLRKVTGDNYGAEFVARAFQGQGVRYEKSKMPKSQLYLELLPQITSHAVELLDVKLLIDQLANLERRTSPSGKDQVTHPRDCHDDLANAVAGLVTIASVTRRRVGAFQEGDIY